MFLIDRWSFSTTSWILNSTTWAQNHSSQFLQYLSWSAPSFIFFLTLLSTRGRWQHILYKTWPSRGKMFNKLSSYWEQCFCIRENMIALIEIFVTKNVHFVALRKLKSKYGMENIRAMSPAVLTNVFCVCAYRSRWGVCSCTPLILNPTIVCRTLVCEHEHFQKTYYSVQIPLTAKVVAWRWIDREVRRYSALYDYWHPL